MSRRLRQERLAAHTAGAGVGRRWACLGLMFAAVAVWWLTRSRLPTIPVPEVDLTHSAPDVKAAVAAARANVQRDPTSAAAWGDLGMWLMAHQFDPEANVCLEQAERFDPKDARWPYLLGLSLSVSERDRAIRKLRRAIELRDPWPIAHLRLGELLLAEHAFDTAAEQLKLAHSQDTSEPRACFSLARLFLLRSDAATALTWAQRAVQLAPEVRSIHELLAEIQLRLGDRDAADAELQLAERSPTPQLGWHDELAAKVLSLRKDVGSQLELAQALLHQQRFDEAIAVLRSALRQSDRDVRLFVVLAQALNHLRRVNEVESLLDVAVRAHPESAELRFQRGVARFQSAKFAEAEEFFREALRLKPDHALAHYNLGHTLLNLDRAHEAEAAFAAAAEFRPSLVPAHVNAARLQLRRGDRTAARQHLQIAAHFQPDDPEVRQLQRELPATERP